MESTQISKNYQTTEETKPTELGGYAASISIIKPEYPPINSLASLCGVGVIAQVVRERHPSSVVAGLIFQAKVRVQRVPQRPGLTRF